MTSSRYQGRRGTTTGIVKKLTRDEENVNDTELYKRKTKMTS
jgi:hypothetical protein